MSEEETMDTGRLVVRRPDGTEYEMGVVYFYPEGHRYHGLHSNNYYMFKGHMAKIVPEWLWTDEIEERIRDFNVADNEGLGGRGEEE